MRAVEAMTTSGLAAHPHPRSGGSGRDTNDIDVTRCIECLNASATLPQHSALIHIALVRHFSHIDRERGGWIEFLPDAGIPRHDAVEISREPLAPQVSGVTLGRYVPPQR